MRSRLPQLLLSSAIGALLVVAPPVAMAFDFDNYGPPGPLGYGEFYQSDESSASDPSSNFVDGGVAVFNGTDLEDAYDAWVASVFVHHGVPQGNFFGEDFDGPGWAHNLEFDSQDAPHMPPAPMIVDGVTISNDLPDALAGEIPSLVLGRAEEPAKADSKPGGAFAIDKLAWEARDEFGPDIDGKEPEATIDFSENKTDFLGFYIFDASKTGTFNLQYTDGTIFTLENKPTRNQENDDKGYYRFVGFVNTHPTQQIERFWVTNAGSKYGIDEIEWGRGNGNGKVPEPGTLWLLSAGLGFVLYRRRRTRLPGSGFHPSAA